MQRLISISVVRQRAVTSSHKCSSLNFPRRKQQALKVATENAAMASRLSMKSSQFSLSKWDEEYSRVLRYKKQISKPHMLPEVTSGKNRLRPAISRCASDL